MYSKNVEIQIKGAIMKQPGKNPNIKPLIITNLIFLFFVAIVIFSGL